MQYSLIAVFAGIAMASPMSLHTIRSCDATSCALALGPAAITCLPAAYEELINPLADANCVRVVLVNVIDTPPVCVGCGTAAVSGVSAGIPTVTNAAVSAFGAVTSAAPSIATGMAGSVTSAAGDAFGNVQSAVTGMF